MNRRTKTSRAENRIQKYLRPGALARIRDSRMIRRGSVDKSWIFPSLSPQSSPDLAEEKRMGVVVVPQVANLEVLTRFFEVERSGPRVLQRKTAFANKTIIFRPPPVVDVGGLDGDDLRFNEPDPDRFLAQLLEPSP